MKSPAAGKLHCPLMSYLEERSTVDACDKDACHAAVLLSCFGYFEPDSAHFDIDSLGGILGDLRKERCEGFLSEIGNPCKGCVRRDNCQAGETIINLPRQD